MSLTRKKKTSFLFLNMIVNLLKFQTSRPVSSIKIKTQLRILRDPIIPYLNDALCHIMSHRGPM